MNELFDEQLDAMLDDLPLAELPDGFVSAVMSSIPAEVEPFRVRSADLLVALAAALLCGVLIIVGMDGAGSVLTARLNEWFVAPVWFSPQLGWIAALLVVEAAIGLALYVGFWDEGEGSTTMAQH